LAGGGEKDPSKASQVSRLLISPPLFLLLDFTISLKDFVACLLLSLFCRAAKVNSLYFERLSGPEKTVLGG